VYMLNSVRVIVSETKLHVFSVGVIATDGSMKRKTKKLLFFLLFFYCALLPFIELFYLPCFLLLKHCFPRFFMIPFLVCVFFFHTFLLQIFI
jgi:hypothetical protein